MEIRGTPSEQQLRAISGLASTVEVVDPVADINQLLARYRVAVAMVLAAAGVLVLLLLGLSAGWQRALHIVALPAVACLCSLGIIGYWHGHYSIVNLLALLLIIGVGLDYGVFRAFSKPRDQGATTLAITLSALTSILAFGMLGFSATPLISAFGQTIAAGLVIAYALSWLSPATSAP